MHVLRTVAQGPGCSGQSADHGAGTGCLLDALVSGRACPGRCLGAPTSAHLLSRRGVSSLGHGMRTAVCGCARSASFAITHAHACRGPSKGTCVRGRRYWYIRDYAGTMRPLGFFLVSLGVVFHFFPFCFSKISTTIATRPPCVVRWLGRKGGGGRVSEDGGRRETSVRTSTPWSSS